MILKNTMTLLFILFIISCSSTKHHQNTTHKHHQNTTHIIEITETKYCNDKNRSFHYIKITKDSTITVWGIRKNEKLNDTLRIKTSDDEWNKLISAIEDNKKNKRPNGNLSVDKNGCTKSITYTTNDNNFHSEALFSPN